MNSLTRRAPSTKHIIKRHQTTCKLVGGVSESRPTYKLKLIKTINYLMLFRFVELVLCTHNKQQQQQHKMIKFFPSIPFSVATHRSQFSAVSFDCFHTQININVLFCGRENEMFFFGIASHCKNMWACFPISPHQTELSRLLYVCFSDRNDVINSRNWLNAGTQVSCFMSSH